MGGGGSQTERAASTWGKSSSNAARPNLAALPTIQTSSETETESDDEVLPITRESIELSPLPSFSSSMSSSGAVTARCGPSPRRSLSERRGLPQSSMTPRVSSVQHPVIPKLGLGALNNLVEAVPQFQPYQCQARSQDVTMPKSKVGGDELDNL